MLLDSTNAIVLRDYEVVRVFFLLELFYLAMEFHEARFSNPSFFHVTSLSSAVVQSISLIKASIEVIMKFMSLPLGG